MLPLHRFCEGVKRAVAHTLEQRAAAVAMARSRYGTVLLYCRFCIAKRLAASLQQLVWCWPACNAA